MKKFIVALDGLRFSQSALEYALYLSKVNNAHLVGVFLDDFTYHSYSYVGVVANEENWDKKVHELDLADEQARKASVRRFEVACQENDVQYSVHRDKNIAYQELLHETVYSDLLIIAANETFASVEAHGLSGFLREVLSDTQCPMLVVPEKFTLPEKTVILFDGDPSSVYALKMFSYLMPGRHALPVEILTVKNEAQSLHVPDNRLMKEFMKRHFSEARYTVLKGDPEKEIASYLQLVEEGTIVVLGAYARSRVSRWFHKSMADHILSSLTLPVFVAHHS